MPITINGSGTITGLSAGGLPDATVTTADIADANITAAKLDGAQSGSAPIYGARAWVNFNGTGTVAIRASGNVSSITDNGTGAYTVNFTTVMPDANFSVASSAINDGVANAIAVPNVINANGFTLSTAQTTAITTAADVNKIYAAVFR